ncbi:MAG: PaaI family thioesterase [Pseudomonadota bacterium]
MSRELLTPGPETLVRIKDLTADSPISKWFGLETSIEDGEHRYKLTFDEPHIGNPVIRALHGGVISAFLQHAATLEVLSRVGGTVKAKSISVHTSYLRGARDQDFIAAVKIERIGRRIAFVEARGWQGSSDEAVGSAAIALRLFED